MKNILGNQQIKIHNHFLSEIQKKIYKTEEHVEIATTLNNLASLYDTIGQKEKALTNYQKVYGMRKNMNFYFFFFFFTIFHLFLPDIELRLQKTKQHCNIAIVLSNMALLHSSLGNKEKAVDMIEEAYGI